ELEAQFLRGVDVEVLFERKTDAERDRFSAGFVGAAIGRFHDAGAASGADVKTFARGADAVERPFGEVVGKACGRIVIVGGSFQPGGVGELFFLFAGSAFGVADFVFDSGQSFGGAVGRGNAGRAVKHDGVVDGVLAKSHARFRQFALNSD